MTDHTDHLPALQTPIEYREGPRPCFLHKTTHTVVVPTSLLMREGVGVEVLPLNTRSILGSGTCAEGWGDPRLDFADDIHKA